MNRRLAYASVAMWLVAAFSALPVGAGVDDARASIDAVEPPSYEEDLRPLYPAYVVTTDGDSMRPTYDEGEQHLCIDQGTDEIENGDVILFDAYGENRGLVFHRVIAVDDDRFRTQGDNNTEPDAWHRNDRYLCHVDS